jgi:hypothetical protein
MKRTSNKFARISFYGDFVVPLNLLEEFLEQCYSVSTEYKNGTYVITKAKKLDNFSVHDRSEIETGLAQAALENN